MADATGNVLDALDAGITGLGYIRKDVPLANRAGHATLLRQEALLRELREALADPYFGESLSLPDHMWDDEHHTASKRVASLLP